MNEIQDGFDYSIVDDKTARFLRTKEQEMQSIVLNSSILLGEKLIEAQERLAKFSNGTFEKWFTSIGLKKTTVYNYINQASFVRQMNEVEQIEMFQELPTTLKTEISKPSAEPEAVELVLSGDIKTTKEYRELEKLLKQKDKQISMQAEMIDELNEYEPEVIEKEVVVEKIPNDYAANQIENKQLRERLSEIEGNYRKLLSERQETDEKSAKYEQLSTAINQAQGQLTETQQLITNYKNLSDLLEQSNAFLSKASALVYQDLNEVISRDGLAKRELGFLVERIEMFLSDLKKVSKTNILEGEIINE